MEPPICLISHEILAQSGGDDRFKFYGHTKIPPPTPPTFLDIVKWEPSAGGYRACGGDRDFVPWQIASLWDNGEIAKWLLDSRNRRALPHRLERCGYVSVRNPDERGSGMPRSK